jgi:hypothetical protein
MRNFVAKRLDFSKRLCYTDTIMKHNTKTTTNKTIKQQDVKEACKDKDATCKCQSTIAQENRIIERSILVTSLLVNLFFLVGWVVVVASSDYAHALGSIIYNM